ncbi:hypothetical protein V8C35DRAFT_327649 [Trichoderma chlorosporum]
MRQHFFLPSRRPAQSDSIFSSNPLARKQSRRFRTSLSKTPTQRGSYTLEAPRLAETKGLGCDEDVKLHKSSSLAPIRYEHEDFPEADATPSSYWDIESLPQWHEASQFSDLRNGNRIGDGGGDGEARESSFTSSIATSPRPVILQDSDCLPSVVDEPTLQVLGPALSISEVSRHLRKTSSSYPSCGKASTRIQSPESMLRPNKLSFTDFSRFSRANDRLSNLRSTLSSDEDYDMTMTTNPQEAMEEATCANLEWQSQPRQSAAPYNQYELTESTDVLPSDSASQQPSLSGARPPINARSSSKKLKGLIWESFDTIKGQYDGISEANNRLQSPVPPTRSPSTPANQEHPHKQTKRKASVFSLHSLANPLSKHPKFGLRKWASNVYQQGSHRLNQARLKWIRPARRDRRMFEAWRLRHRGMSHDSSPCKEKADRTSGIYSSEGRVCANEDWWMEGVKIFEAPKWMNFSGFSRY